MRPRAVNPLPPPAAPQSQPNLAELTALVPTVVNQILTRNLPNLVRHINNPVHDI